MKRYLNKILLAGSILAMVFSIAACGSSNKYAYDAGDMPAMESSSYYANSSSDEWAEEWAEEEWAEEAELLPDSDMSGNKEYTNFVIESDRKLVYNCYLNMETLHFNDTVSTVKALISKYEGFIQEENQTDDAHNWYYADYHKNSATLSSRIVVRIPTKNYDAFLSELEGNGKITSKNQNIDDITRAYADTETTIATLKKEEERLLEMMDRAETIEEMITVEDRLSEVQNELARYNSNLKSMDLDVNYSTITLNIDEVLEYTPDTPPVYKSTFGQRLMNTLKDSWSNFTGFLEGLLFFLIYALPILLILGVIGLGIFFIIRAIIKANRKRRAKKQAKQTASPAEENQ